MAMESGSVLSRIAAGALATAGLVASGGGYAAAAGGGHAAATGNGHATTAGSGHAAGTTAGNAPAGNNGTVKIDEYTADGGNGNDPHVSCGFTVNFFGYDGGSGTDTATISVTPVAPTAGGSQYHASTSWPAGTRTAGDQWDASIQVSGSDLAGALAGVSPQPQQGYHLRLEAEVTGSQGSDDKYKTFWMTPCAGSVAAGGAPAARPATPPTTAAPPTTVAPPTTAPTPTPAAGTPAPVTPVPVTPTPAGTITAAPGGAPTSTGTGGTGAQSPALAATRARTLATIDEAATGSGVGSTTGSASAVTPLAAPLASASLLQAAHPASTASSGSLAFTGADVEVLLGAATVLVGLGGVAVVATRRRNRSLT